MAKKLSFDAYLGWVNITNPNQIPADARVIGANDLLRYEKLGKDTAEKFAEVDSTLDGLKSDTVISDLIADAQSETRYAVDNMVKSSVATGVAKFQKVIDEVPAKVQEQVTPLVAAAIAADDTLVTAAAAAVGAELEDAGVLHGANEVYSPDILFSITDQDSKRSWLEFGKNGGPTENSKEFIRDVFPAVPEEIPAGGPVMFGIVDEAGKRSWLETGYDGKPTPESRALFFDGALPAGSVSSTSLDAEVRALIESGSAKVEDAPEIVGGTLYVNQAVSGRRVRITTTGNPRDARVTRDGHVVFTTDAGTFHVPPGGTAFYPFTPVKRLAFWGDSLTDSSSGDYYPTKAAEILGLPFFQGGVSGQSSADIAMRQGGNQPVVTFPGGVIPAGTTSVPVEMEDNTGYRADGTSSGWSTLGTLTLANGTAIPGRISGVAPLSERKWSFGRTTAGSEIVVTGKARFVGADAVPHQSDIAVIWVGRNNVNPNVSLDQAKRDVAKMVDFLKPYTKQYVIISVTNGTGEKNNGSAYYRQIVEHNAYLAATYGQRYYDLRRNFIDKGLNIAGITPTSEDLSNIALDAPPPSLMNDNLHPTPAGYEAIGTLVAQFISSKGWHL